MAPHRLVERLSNFSVCLQRMLFLYHFPHFQYPRLTWLFARSIESGVDYMATLRSFVLRTDQLCVTLLQQSAQHALLADAALDFFETVLSLILLRITMDPCLEFDLNDRRA